MLVAMGIMTFQLARSVTVISMERAEKFAKLAEVNVLASSILLARTVMNVAKDFTISQSVCVSF